MLQTRHRYNSWFCRILKKLLDVNAITLYPFIFYADPKEKVDKVLMAHEMIHIDQIQRVGFWSFYISYGIYYLAGLVHYKNHRDAYTNIPFEEEAYRLQDDPSKQVIV